MKTLPYDRDSILRALEARATTPRPHTRELDSLFQAFRAPFLAFASASYRERKLRDSLTNLKLRLDSLPRGAADYRDLYLRFSRQADSLAAATAARTRAQIPLDRARRTLVPRIDSLRNLVARWEDSTFREYDSATERLSTARLRDPTADSTGPDGRAKLRLGPGRWWVYAHSWDATDPYASWYWNVPVEGDSVVLDSRTGRRRPKY